MIRAIFDVFARKTYHWEPADVVTPDGVELKVSLYPRDNAAEGDPTYCPEAHVYLGIAHCQLDRPVKSWNVSRVDRIREEQQGLRTKVRDLEQEAESLLAITHQPGE